MDDVLKIVTDESLTYNQQLIALAHLAESFDHTIPLAEEYVKAREEKIFCDLGEGNAPYRPRYICPDYRILMEKGSAFLDLQPPTDLLEAVNALLIMYKHVPSITTFPVYLGNIDTLLDPFVQKEDRAFAKKVIKMFLLNIDRTLTDSFVHANIGPKDTLTGRLILECTEEMQCAMPNITLKYDPKETSDEFLKLCAICMLKTAKPSIANAPMFEKEWGKDFAIASCYNGLIMGGGGFTLPRLRLYECSLKANSVEDFIDRVLPYYSEIQLKVMDDRIDFIVERSAFFKSNFLVKEGFVKLENFTGMFGMVGLAECVNHLLGIEDPKQGYGNNKEADDLGVRIVEKLDEIVSHHHNKYCNATDHHFRLHAQVGIDTDGRENSPGARIPVGAEPGMLKQIQHATRFHKYFATGIGDIFNFEETWINTPDALCDIIKGAMDSGMRYFSGYLENTDVVRVTGYLVKKSEIAKLDAHQQSLNNVTINGKGARDTAGALSRRLEKGL